MRCAICGEECGSAKQELWGPEFAHSTCVIAFKQGQIDRQEILEQQLGAAQAKIDELMLEYCPNEMTQEQLDEYAKHQKPVSEGELPEFLRVPKGNLK